MRGSNSRGQSSSRS
ncbi:unnamed protein product [Priceomyces carsonii]|nr:unnamed protein product [Priceomyces carsonii]CUM66308.1 unnamed protein product [Priceomyces carsonii]CUM66358.1 unnamed protein product [Priceomyces carsonii]